MDSSGLLDTIDLLPLIADVILVVDPSLDNLKRWRYDYRRFSRLTRERIFLPIVSESSSPFPYSIRRNQLLEDDEFFAEYESAITRDQEDDEFCELSEASGLDPDEAAFNINWDLILAQLVGAPIISPPQLHSLWEHKFLTSIRDLTEARSPSVAAKNAHILKRFFYRAMEFPPSSLSITELLEFRKDQRSTKFREWFGMELTKVSRASRVLNIQADEVICNDFNELVQGYTSKSSKISGTLSALSGIAGAYLGGILGGGSGAAMGATPAFLGTYGFPQILRSVWRKYGENNWVFMFLEFRSNPRP